MTVQDEGRPGFMHLGLPPGGPLAPSRFGLANAAVGNGPGDACVEVIGEFMVCAQDGPAWVAADGDAATRLRPGEEFAVGSSKSARVRYLAVRGGFDVPVVFGGRGTLLVAGLGGLEGRILRRGDVLPVGSPELSGRDARAPTASVQPSDAVRVVGGPDGDADLLAQFLATRYIVSARADRIGARLEGPPLMWRARPGPRASTPMVAGAIEVPGDGVPIVLGPDHPTTGGYPVVAVVVRAELERVVAAPLGTELRFFASH
ncbi:MAG: biotin-dependent carboxyltransferase family protein [Myxococcales bacterium]|nr:biotin-dependent carboxyltransferase family protein [Myxococcales bacterium]